MANENKSMENKNNSNYKRIEINSMSGCGMDNTDTMFYDLKHKNPDAYHVNTQEGSIEALL